MTVRKDHSSLDCLCQNRLWLFLPAKIGSEIQKTTWLWIYRLQTRSQYFVIHNHTKKKKKKQMEDVTLWIHWCHLYIICISRRSLFIYFLMLFFCAGGVKLELRLVTFILLCCSVVYLMADCADQHALNRPHHYITAPLSVQRDRMDFFLWACSAGCALSWSDRAWTHRSELYMML